MEELARLAEVWGTKVRAARERNFARARMMRVGDPQRREPEPVLVKKAAKGQKLMAESWPRAQSWALRTREPQLTRIQSPQKLRKRKPEPTELLRQGPAWLWLESPRKQLLVQAWLAAEARELAGHWPRTLLAQARSQKMRELPAPSKNNSRSLRSPQASEASGTAVPRKPQAFPKGGRSLPA